MMTKTIGSSTLPVQNAHSMPPITAREMMVRNLITLRPDMDALEALDLLLRQRISGAPVVDEGNRFVGIFSEKSCMKFVVGLAYDDLPSTEVIELVDANPPTITEETDLLTVAQTFLNEACRRLPVLDDRGRLRGQISRRDVMRAVRSHVQSQPPKQRPAAGLFLSALLSSDDRPI
ncbi:MAG: CBS domain-containing protein [Planctomycetota bacterium]